MNIYISQLYLYWCFNEFLFYILYCVSTLIFLRSWVVSRESWLVNLMCNVLLPFWNNQIIRQVSADFFDDVSNSHLLVCKLIYGPNVLNCGWNRHVSSCHSLYLCHACAEYKENQVNIRDPSSFYTAPSPPHKLRNQAIHSSPRIQLSHLFFFELLVWWPV